MRVSVDQAEEDDDEEEEEYADASEEGPQTHQYVPTGYVMSHPHHFQEAAIKSQSARKARRDSVAPSTPTTPSRPSTARSMQKSASASKINPVIKRAPGLVAKKSDPVKRFQRLQNSWRKDTFLHRESKRTNTLWQC
jgi:hypothetical protein